METSTPLNVVLETPDFGEVLVKTSRPVTGLELYLAADNAVASPLDEASTVLTLRNVVTDEQYPVHRDTSVLSEARLAQCSSPPDHVRVQVTYLDRDAPGHLAMRLWVVSTNQVKYIREPGTKQTVSGAMILAAVSKVVDSTFPLDKLRLFPWDTMFLPSAEIRTDGWYNVSTLRNLVGTVQPLKTFVVSAPDGVTRASLEWEEQGMGPVSAINRALRLGAPETRITIKSRTSESPWALIDLKKPSSWEVVAVPSASVDPRVLFVDPSGSVVEVSIPHGKDESTVGGATLLGLGQAALGEGNLLHLATFEGCLVSPASSYAMGLFTGAVPPRLYLNQRDSLADVWTRDGIIGRIVSDTA